MQIKEAKEVLKKAYEMRLPVFIHGAAGIGKSVLTHEVAKELEIQLIDVRLSQMDAVDLRGLPITYGEKEKRTTWVFPDFLPSNENSAGILFLDELNLALPSVQHAAYQLILDRKLGNYNLPSKWICVAAGNRAEDKANIFELPAPLNNRFAQHIDLDIPEIKAWNEWATQNKIDVRIITFLNFKPSLLHKFDAKMKENAWASPRTWEFCSKMISGEKSAERIKNFSMGAVGEGAGRELNAFIKLFDSYDVQEILEKPEKTKLPTEVDKLWSFVGAVGNYTNEHQKYRQNCLKIVLRLEPEYAILLLKIIFDKTKSADAFDKFPEINTIINKYGKFL
jgi:SpoVK/Ycf46/Vps4 family AAA+-type ATPase